MSSGRSGFHNAPVSRTFVIACAILSIFLRIQGEKMFATIGVIAGGGFTRFDYGYYLDIMAFSKGLFRKCRLWSLIASKFAFSSTLELMFGLYLLYYFRVFERHIGSNKYSIFILFSLILTSLFEVLALTLLKGTRYKMQKHLTSLSYYTSSILASGPYGLIFSSFVPFYFDIPVTTRFHVFGFHFSNKSFIYLAGVQLLLSSWKRFILPGLFGVLAVSIYLLNLFGIRKLKLPEFITSFFSRLSQPPSAGSSSTTFRGNSSGMYLLMQVTNQRNFPSLASLAEPPEDSIAMLVSMGFDRNSARNDVSAATNILLEAQSH